jgi:hypothetical protein
MTCTAQLSMSPHEIRGSVVELKSQLMSIAHMRCVILSNLPESEWTAELDTWHCIRHGTKRYTYPQILFCILRNCWDVHLRYVLFSPNRDPDNDGRYTGPP